MISYKCTSNPHDRIDWKFIIWTCFCRFSTGSSSSRIRKLARATKNGTYILLSRVWHSKIIVVSIVINSVPLLKLSNAIPTEINKLFFSVFPQWLRRFTWKVTLTKSFHGFRIKILWTQNEESKQTKCYLVGEKDTVVSVAMNRVNPRIADEMNRAAMAGNILQSHCLQVKLAPMIVSNDESFRYSHTLLPFKENSQLNLLRR